MGKMKVNGQDFLSAGDAQVMEGSTSVLDGMEGLVPQPLAGDEGKVLYGDGTWKTPTGGASAINDLTDVNITTPSNGQVLKYNSTSSKWENSNESGGTTVVPNPIGTPTDTLDTIEIDGDIYEIQGGSSKTVEEKITYYATDAQISDGTNHQFVTVQLDEPLEEEQGYIMVLKNSLGGSTVKKVFFNYLNYGSYYSINIDGGSSIGTMSLQITSTTITCTNYTGSWQDIYIDVYRSNPTGGLSPIIYSTVEREIGVWTDGKPLYCKTIQATLTSITHQIDVSGLDIDTFVDAKGFLRYQSGNDDQTTDYPYYSGSDYWSGGYFNKGQKIYYVQSSNDSVRYYNIANITFYYTKTTDTPGSGSYTTLGTPTVHYTTDEQVIGTWIDGKPLYRSIIEFSGGKINAGSQVDFSVIGTLPSNVKRWIKTDLVTYDSDSGLTTNMFGTIFVKAINYNTNKVAIFNYQITQFAVLPQTGNYVIAEYTKTTD